MLTDPKTVLNPLHLLCVKQQTRHPYRLDIRSHWISPRQQLEPAMVSLATEQGRSNVVMRRRCKKEARANAIGSRRPLVFSSPMALTLPPPFHVFMPLYFCDPHLLPASLRLSLLSRSLKKRALK